jgi:hypothetical protein
MIMGIIMLKGTYNINLISRPETESSLLLVHLKENTAQALSVLCTHKAILFDFMGIIWNKPQKKLLVL